MHTYRDRTSDGTGDRTRAITNAITIINRQKQAKVDDTQSTSCASRSSWLRNGVTNFCSPPPGAVYSRFWHESLQKKVFSKHLQHAWGALVVSFAQSFARRLGVVCASLRRRLHVVCAGLQRPDAEAVTAFADGGD
jgi:hypothetical protein